MSKGYQIMKVYRIENKGKQQIGKEEASRKEIWRKALIKSPYAYGGMYLVSIAIGGGMLESKKRAKAK